MPTRHHLKRDVEDHRDLKVTQLLNLSASAVLPSKVDLRPSCPPVYDQGQEGSCTANAGCANLSMELGKPETMFSRQFLYRMERNIEGTPMEDSGASMRDIAKALNQFGVCEDSFMPYTQSNLFGEPTAEATQNALTHRITSYHSVANLNEIKQTLALQNKPVLMGMEVFESMESPQVAKTGILPMPKAQEQNLGGHAVLIVGYIDGNEAVSTEGQLKESFEHNLGRSHRRKPKPKPRPKPQPVPVPTPQPKPVDPSQGYLIVRNSWGANWGQNGYFLMPYNYVLKGLAFDFWTIQG